MESKPKHPGGRPSHLTEDIITQVEALLREGHYAITVCNLLGIPERTYYNWLEWGEKRPDTLYARFWQAVKTASAQAEVGALEELKAASSDKKINWTPLAWFLERRYKGRWAKVDITAHTEDRGVLDPDAWKRDVLGVRPEANAGTPADAIQPPQGAEETDP